MTFSHSVGRGKVGKRILVRTSIFIVWIGLLTGSWACSKPLANTPKTVEQVDLDRYKGLWYEIARIPNRFQKHCVEGVTAHYSFDKSGQIAVINRCLESDGNYDEAKGVARIVDTRSNAKLEVSFVSIFGNPIFWGAYWIIDLGSSYEFAIVGHPQRKYGWILSRRPKMEKKQLESLFSILKSQGYSPSDFVMTKH
ncbi:MAG: lipocalin family protein [SAR324 cluster bacterium]|nr:lipocalin family protein [SAR324 cluster bacterium]